MVSAVAFPRVDWSGWCPRSMRRTIWIVGRCETGTREPELVLTRFGLDAAQRVDREAQALAVPACGVDEVDGIAQGRVAAALQFAGQDLGRQQDHGRQAVHQGLLVPGPWRRGRRGDDEAEACLALVRAVERQRELRFREDLALDRADAQALEE